MKKKKVLLGLGIGTLMATTPFLTACRSDITFNQSDLDNAIKNVNEYLETQNNYSSEFAKNVLNDYLLKGIERNQNNTKFGYKLTNEVQNIFNDSKDNSEVVYKIFRQGNSIKEMCNITGSNVSENGLLANTKNYRELTSEYKALNLQEPESSGSSVITRKNYYYSGNVYKEDLTKTIDKYAKTNIQDRNINELRDWMPGGDISNIYSNFILAVVAPETSYFSPDSGYTSQTDVVMDQDGEFEVFTFTNVFAENADGEVCILSYNMKFKDGVLQSVRFTNSIKDNSYENITYNQVLTIEITENIEDFSFDKSNY